MKRRDFLKGLLGAIGVGVGSKLLPDAPPSVSVELPEIEMPEVENPIATFRTWETQHGLYADGITREIIAGERLVAGNFVYIGQDGKAYHSEGVPLGVSLGENVVMVYHTD